MENTFLIKEKGIFSADWCDLVFNLHNREYGGYILRKASSKRHLKAIFTALMIFTAAVGLPVLIKSMNAESDELQVEATELTNIKIDEPPAPEDVVLTPPEPVIPVSSIKFVPPVIAPDDQVNDEDEIKQQEDLNGEKAIIGGADVDGQDSTAVDISSLNPGNTGLAVDPPPFVFVEQMPEFPGGDVALLKFISAGIRYPQMALDAGREGIVYVEFVVNRDGSVSDISIIRSPDELLSKEAVRVIKTMPKWKPGKQGGETVRVLFRMPINFKIY